MRQSGLAGSFGGKQRIAAIGWLGYAQWRPTLFTPNGIFAALFYDGDSFNPKMGFSR
jgi:hypothetical protein